MTSKPPPKNKPLFGMNNVLFSSPNAPSTSSEDANTSQNPNETLDLAFVPEHTDNEQSEEHTEQTMRIPVEDARSLSPSNERFVSIRVISGTAMLKFHILNPGDQSMVGTEEQCELHLNNIENNKKHAVINYTKGKKLNIIDVGSTNGTFVNQERIDPMSQLIDGDYIEIGDITLQVKLVNQMELQHMREVIDKLQNALKDPLTDLFRRDFLETELPKIVEQQIQQGEPISCAFVDLDKFKSVNDTFGHQIGDKVLHSISQIMKIIVRKNDHCVRYGGDEMLIIFPRLSEQRAHRVVERIRHQISITAWGQIADGLQVSASFGVAELRNQETIPQWLHRADMAAYAAKDGGRNQVRTYGSLSLEEKRSAGRRL